MLNHEFIFKPRVWLGQGKISVHMVTEKISFYSRWMVDMPEEKHELTAVQEIEMENVSEKMKNQFTFYDIRNEKFSLFLENPIIGKVIGNGLFDEKVIAWEFRDVGAGLEGYEVYELQQDGHYRMRAEYSSQEKEHTFIEGDIWPKISA